MWAVMNPLAESVHSTTVGKHSAMVQPYSFPHINCCLLAGVHGQLNEPVQREASETVLASK